jgi:hypothetical protein
MFNQEEFIVKHHNFSFEFVEHWTVEIGFPCYDTRIWSKIYQKILVPYPFQLYCFDRFGLAFIFQKLRCLHSNRAHTIFISNPCRLPLKCLVGANRIAVILSSTVLHTGSMKTLRIGDALVVSRTALCPDVLLL